MAKKKTYDPNEMFRDVARLAALGWKIVKLYGVRPDGTCTCSTPGCRNTGKHPSGADWQHRATSDENVIARWCDDAGQSDHTRINFGVRLGECSGIIDVEYDNDEAEASIRRFGLDMVDTPSYQSGRGVHRIFQHEDWMPDSAMIKVHGIEVRIGGGGKAGQSVIPPSWHARGTQYEWLPGKSPDDIQPAKLPEVFREAVLAASRRQGSGIVAQAMTAVANGESFSVGNRHACLIGVASHHASRIPVFNEKELNILINTMLDCNRRCSPPKAEDEVVKIAKDQFAYYQRRRIATESRYVFARAGLAWNAEDRCWDPGEWRLTVVNADPVEYKLRIPCPHTAGKTLTVVLNADIWYSSRGVAVAILKESKTLDMHSPTAARWSAIWNGEEHEEGDGASVWSDGLREKLMADADQEYPGPEFSTTPANAAILLQYIDQQEMKEPETEEDRLPRRNGQPRWIKNARGVWQLWLKPNETMSQAWSRQGQKAITAVQAAGRRLFEQIEEKSGRPIPVRPCNRKSPDGRRISGRYRVLDELHINALREIADGESVPDGDES